MTLDKYLKTKIFDPLNMSDTFFEVPQNKIDRFTTLYNQEKNGELNVFDNPIESPFANDVTLFSGAGGLLSTTNDYLVFCQMLLNGGIFNGQRIIQPSTLSLMLEDHAKGLKYKRLIFGKKKGFGLGFQVVNKSDTKFGSKGTYGWGGIFGTYFRIDPVENMIFIYMTQSFETYKLKLSDKFRGLVYDSILE
jgi:CubicO group peptidase (beta-lactamase class C family)